MATTNEFLRRIQLFNQGSRTVVDLPIPETIQGLIDMGLVRKAPMVRGTERTPTGQIWLSLTEEGEKRLSS